MKEFYNLNSEEAITSVKTTENGLSSSEAQSRLAENGKNELAEGKRKTMLARFFAQMKDVMIIVLLAAAAVSAVLSIVEKNYADLVDSGIILLIVIVNAVIGMTQESKAENALDALKNMNKPLAKVLRDGKLTKISSSDVVVGDVVILEAGDSIPADIRLISSASLKVEEAALTGESVPSEKTVDVIDGVVPLGDRKNMVYSGGAVSYGRGRGVVVATGMNTEVGKIAAMLNESDNQTTPLQVQLAKTAKLLSVIILVIAAVIFATTILKTLAEGNKIDTDVVVGCFMTAVAIAVAAIPEGLPAVVTVVLAVGVQRMSERKAIVRNLPAVETLGCCQIICSDKTGTLTLNQMTVKQLYTPADGLNVGGKQDTLIKGMVLCNDTINSDGKLLGDPTETALVAYAKSVGIDTDALIRENVRVNEIPFDSVRKKMTTVNEIGGKKTAYIKGAVDLMLDCCTKILDGDTVRNFTAEDRKAVEKANYEMAQNALRVLAVAVNDNVELAQTEEGMTFVGLVGMIDPPRPEVLEAVRVCKKAGMRAVMITGDHIDTACAIAKEIGIIDSDRNLFITGHDLDQLSDEEFDENLDDYRVFARVSPENKVRIVKAFRARGYVTAMTGDGVNDAPSIKSADIGIGMGITGTDVSKGASDIVLADDNFATIIKAVEEGRKVYTNIKKAIQFLLSANIAEVLCLFIVTLAMPVEVEFLTPVMILWVNLLTDALPALALGMEKAEKNVMDGAPRKGGQSLFAGKTGIDIIVQGAMQTCLVLASFFIGHFVFESEHLYDPSYVNTISMTMAFVTLCMVQLFHSYNLKKNGTLLSKGILDNKMLNISFIVGVVLLAFVIAVPFMNTAFSTTLLNVPQLAIAAGLAFLVIPLVELQKCIEGYIGKRKN